MMKNNRFIIDSDIIQCSYEKLLNHLPYPAAIKSHDSVYVGSNNIMSDLCGFNSPEDMIGNADADLKCPAASMCDNFVIEDKKTLTHNIINKTLDICTYSDNKIHICLSTKSKVIDNSNNHFVFLLIHELKNDILNHNIVIKENTTSNQQTSFNIGRHFPETTLSIRESECYYYLLRGYTAKETAKALGTLSNRTVESHVINIKNKLGCTNKRDLIGYGFSNKLMNFIPESLF